jgi:hypothetical protein
MATSNRCRIAVQTLPVVEVTLSMPVSKAVFEQNEPDFIQVLADSAAVPLADVSVVSGIYAYIHTSTQHDRLANIRLSDTSIFKNMYVYILSDDDRCLFVVKILIKLSTYTFQPSHGKQFSEKPVSFSGRGASSNGYFC